MGERAKHDTLQQGSRFGTDPPAPPRYSPPPVHLRMVMRSASRWPVFAGNMTRRCYLHGSPIVAITEDMDLARDRFRRTGSVLVTTVRTALGWRVAPLRER